MKTKKILRMQLMLMCAVMTSCTDFDAIQTLQTTTEKDLSFSTTVTDALGSSEATITISSSVTSDDEIIDFHPTAYLRVELEHTYIEVSEASQMNVELMDEQIVSSEEDASDGKVDVIKQFTYSDGQVATVYYGWQFERKELADGVLNAPHVEITSVKYSDYTSEDVTEESATITLVFQASLTGVDATYAHQETIELKPRYTKALLTADSEAQPTYRFYVQWNEWDEENREVGFRIYAYKTVGDEETLLQENGEFFHLYLNGVWPDGLYAVESSEIESFTFKWYPGLIEEEDPFTRNYFTSLPIRYQYWYSPSYMLAGIDYIESYNFSTQTLEFNDDGYTAVIEVGVVPEMSGEVKYMSERSANVYEDVVYVGTDIQHLVVTNYVRADGVDVTTNKNGDVLYEGYKYIDLFMY